VSTGDVLRALARVLDALADEREGEHQVPGPSADVRELGWVPIKQCGLPERTARAGVKSGELEAAKVGRDVYVNRDSVEGFVASRRIVQRDAKPDADEGDEIDHALRRRAKLCSVRGGR
jgi:hypothetical protein